MWQTSSLFRVRHVFTRYCHRIKYAMRRLERISHRKIEFLLLIRSREKGARDESGDVKMAPWHLAINVCQTRIVPSMPCELPGAGYHPYLEVLRGASKFPSNSCCPNTRAAVSRVGQDRAGRVKSVIESQAFNFNFKQVNNIKSFDYPARILAQSSSAPYVTANNVYRDLDYP